MNFRAALTLYSEYEQLVREAGAPVADMLAPPHRDPAAAIAHALPGCTLPDDLVAWWAWHDGTVPRQTPHGPGWFPVAVGAGWAFRSLEGTLAERQRWLQTAELSAEPPELPAEAFWPTSWLPIVGSEHSYLAADLAEATKDRTRISYVERETLAAHAPDVAERWSEVVGWWVRLLQLGATTWSPTAGTWVTDETLVPDDLRGNPVAYAVIGPRDPRFDSRSPY
ncbi:SMI1/KNR4 family protein [Cellulomonas sp. NS3]|uniref:SMI1/KNR4 family protein n=1 Tax=Cellulomonas sp. NS3 TaxID=2973977 RepID=UPI002163EF99|nr:SMI1/KNR4 family protein [Cellulomonas sp. NS3]